MLLHVAHAPRQENEMIVVCSVDTDVVVLAVAAQTISVDAELWLAFGTGIRFHYLAAHELAISLGPDKSRVLMFHALTICDISHAINLARKKNVRKKKLEQLWSSM